MIYSPSKAAVWSLLHMKQKIVIQVLMKCKKCRSKAMKIAVKADGVSKVEIQGAEKDQLVLIGEEVDSVKLTCTLRKKLHYASLLSVQEEKDKEEEKKKKEEEWPVICYYQNPAPHALVCEANPPICCIM